MKTKFTSHRLYYFLKNKNKVRYKIRMQRMKNKFRLVLESNEFCYRFNLLRWNFLNRWNSHHERNFDLFHGCIFFGEVCCVKAQMKEKLYFLKTIICILAHFCIATNGYCVFVYSFFYFCWQNKKRAHQL